MCRHRGDVQFVNSRPATFAEHRPEADQQVDDAHNGLHDTDYIIQCFKHLRWNAHLDSVEFFVYEKVG